MPNINPVDLQTLGARVTDPAQLTEGRWYAVRVNCSGAHNPLVHAKYIGVVFSSVHEFEVCDDDYEALQRSLGLARRIGRDSSSIRTGKINGGGVCEVFKFKQVVANQSNTSAPAATLSPIDQIKSEIDALNAQKQIKQEEIDKLTKDVATIGGEVDKLKQKVADSLKDYLPEPKKPIW